MNEWYWVIPLMLFGFVGGLLLYEWLRTRREPKPKPHGWDSEEP